VVGTVAKKGLPRGTDRATRLVRKPQVRLLLGQNRQAMRIAVIGKQGQVASALIEVGPKLGVEVLPVGRPEVDLLSPETAHPALANIQPDIIVNAAAYTAVDQAEKEPEVAMAINADGAMAVANAARTLNVPLVHLSTDYVFDGSKSTPYVEQDPVGPVNVYGASKLAGEHAVAAATRDHLIIRTAWVYSPYGKNFVRTMLALAQSRDEVRVVADQCGCPTYAHDIAVSIVTIGRNLLDRPQCENLRGVFHLVCADETSWAGLASAIFESLRLLGRPVPKVTPITSAEYPTPARRPANSRLDCSKLERVYNVRLPSWRTSLMTCLERLTNDFKQS
jgi:dTDP-4-dehydrorhamnose reductase